MSDTAICHRLHGMNLNGCRMQSGLALGRWNLFPPHLPFIKHPPPPAKRLSRTANGHAAFTNGEGSPFSMTGFTNSAMGSLNQAVWGYNSFPAGMQGARYDAFYASSFSSYPRDMSHPCTGNSFENNTF